MLASNNANCTHKLIQIEIKIQCINLQKQYNFLKTHISKLLKKNKKFHFSPSAPKYIIHSLFHIKHLPIKKKAYSANKKNYKTSFNNQTPIKHKLISRV